MAESLMDTQLEKLRTYTASGRRKSTSYVGRSLNPNFPSISKQDDVTRYNSLTYNVYYYKDYPHRDGTPIKSTPVNRKTGFRPSVPPRVKYLRGVFSSTFGS